MKFLCVECDRQMAFEERQLPGDGTLAAAFRCPQCGRVVALLTNPMETQLVASLGVKIGGATLPPQPLEMVRGMVTTGRDDAFEESREKGEGRGERPGHRRDHPGGDGHGAQRARPRGDVNGFDERRVHGLRVVIDRNQCVGFGDCVKEAPEGFKLDDATVAVFLDPEAVECERLLRACEACPVDAISVYDETGKQIVPRPA